MAFIAPSPDDFRAKFPEFDEDYLSDDQIQSLLDEASRSVDTTWTEGDFPTAILYLAAWQHQVDLDYGGGQEGGGSTVQSESIGGIFNVTYDRTKAAGDDDYDQNIYGKRYKRLRKLNFPGGITTGGVAG